jgi:hypothetical protein
MDILMDILILRPGSLRFADGDGDGDSDLTDTGDSTCLPSIRCTTATA